MEFTNGYGTFASVSDAAVFTEDDRIRLERVLSSSSIGATLSRVSDIDYTHYLHPEVEHRIRNIVAEELDKRFEKLRNALAPVMSEEEINDLLR